jgi:hypothetical protein
MSKSLHFKVKYVGRKKLRDYDGMNYYAAKKLGYPHIDKPNVVHVANDLSSYDKGLTVKHEINEARLMKLGFKYWKAHSIAEKDKLVKKALRR